eukprot:TRINITY_DN49563_c0_g1_i1.p1 TRINITY_DN49563_c0_g1~~TRINITY_DN49563_c0_g1_i1.p1  ORF type:complete len:517 (-),score=76.97 TRINITY_DN49563_c0_g1_i1:51-1520(-)
MDPQEPHLAFDDEYESDSEDVDEPTDSTDEAKAKVKEADDAFEEKTISPSVYLASSGITILNLFLVGLETDLGCMTCLERNWLIVDFIFTVLLISDVAVRMVIETPARFFLGRRRTWRTLRILNILDSMIVFSRLLGALFAAGGYPTALKSVSACRIIFIFVPLRKLAPSQYLHELQLIANSLGDVCRALLCVSSSMALVIGVLAIALTKSIGREDDEVFDYSQSRWTLHDYWGTVPNSMFTLFQVVTFDDWSSRAVRPVVNRYPLLVIVFAVFLCITVLCMLGIMTGIVVGSMLRRSTKKKEQSEKEHRELNLQVIESMRDIFQQADTDGNGLVDTEELKVMLTDSRVHDRLMFLGINTRDIARLHFMLDDRKTGEAGIDRLFRCCARLLGPCSSADVYHFSMDLRRSLAWCERLVNFSDRNGAILQSVLDDIEELGNNIVKDPQDWRDPVLMARRRRHLFERKKENRKSDSAEVTGEPQAMLCSESA